MADNHGKFVWYELMTSNVKTAADFYSGVVGWTAKDSAMPGMEYTIFNAGAAGERNETRTLLPVTHESHFRLEISRYGREGLE